MCTNDPDGKVYYCLYRLFETHKAGMIVELKKNIYVRNI